MTQDGTTTKMTRHDAGRAVAGFASLGYIGTAALHATGYGFVARLSSEAPADLRPLVPALWLAFSADLVILGLIIGVVALKAPRGGKPILVLAGLMPLAAAGLQLASIGFVPPTAILLFDAGLAILAGILLTRSG